MSVYISGFSEMYPGLGGVERSLAEQPDVTVGARAHLSSEKENASRVCDGSHCDFAKCSSTMPVVRHCPEGPGSQPVDQDARRSPKHIRQRSAIHAVCLLR